MGGTAQEPGSRHMVGRDTPNLIGKGASPEVQRTNTAYLLSPLTDTFLFLLDPDCFLREVFFNLDLLLFSFRICLAVRRPHSAQSHKTRTLVNI